MEAVVAHEMLAWIGDLLAERMAPLQGIEASLVLTALGIGGRSDAHLAVLGGINGVDLHGGAGDVAGQSLEVIGVVGGEDPLGASGEPGVEPGEQHVPKALAESLGGV